MKLKKISNFYFFLLTFGLVLFTSCERVNEYSYIQLDDQDCILNSDTRNLITSHEMKYPTKVQVLDSLPFGSSTQICDSLWANYSTLEKNDVYGILVVASKHPNYVFVRLGSYFDGAMSCAKDNALGSKEYYANQLVDTLDINDKLINAINQLFVSQNILANSVIFENLKGEILGPLYSWSTPDDGFLYKILYVFQRPFVWMINLTGNFYVGLLIAWLIFFIIAFCIGYNIIKKYAEKQRAHQFTNADNLRMQGLLTLTECVVFIPMILGAMSLSVQLSNTGVEFSKNLVEFAGLKFSFIDGVFSSSLSQPNWIIGALAIITFYISKYKPDSQQSLNIKAGVLGFLVILSPACLQWSIFLFFLHGFIINLNIYLNNTYRKYKNIDPIASIIYTIIMPVIIAVAAYLGNMTANWGVNKLISRIELQHVSKSTFNNDNPRPHILSWCSQFDSSIKNNAIENFSNNSEQPTTDDYIKVSQKQSLYDNTVYTEIIAECNITDSEREVVLCLSLKDTISNNKTYGLLWLNKEYPVKNIIYGANYQLLDYGLCTEQPSLSDSVKLESNSIQNNSPKIIGMISNEGRNTILVYPSTTIRLNEPIESPHYYMVPSKFQDRDKVEVNGLKVWGIWTGIAIVLYLLFILYQLCFDYWLSTDEEYHTIKDYINGNKVELFWIPTISLIAYEVILVILFIFY